MIKCVIAETDQASIKKLSEYIQQQPHFTVEASFTSGKILMAYLNKNAADIVFINLDLHDIKNYSFLEQIHNCSEKIIISSNKNLAVDGYHFEVSGFLHKPISQVKFLNALKKSEAKILATQKSKQTRPAHHQFLFIRADYKLMKIKFEDILYIEGLKDYSKIYTAPSAGKAIITLQNLKSFEEKLSSEDFIRVHRSYIVALSKIDMIHKNSILIGKNEIPISDGFRSQLHTVISKYT